MAEVKAGPQGLICRTCQRVTDLSGRHWLEECEEPTMHPMLIQGAIERRVQDDYHATLDCLSVTEVLGKVREAAIKCSLPYWPKAQGLNSRAWGSAIGRETESGWKAAGWRTQVRLSGGLWGIPFRGTLDACTVAGDVRYIADDKAVAESNMFYARGSVVARKEFSAQIVMYGMLMPDDQDTDFVTGWCEATSTEGFAWVGAMTRAEDKKSGQEIDSWCRQRAEPMTLEEIAALKPSGSRSTVRENAEMLWAFKQAVKAGADPRVEIGKIPMHCEPMYGGACRLYCDAALTCLRLAGVRLAAKGIVDVAVPWSEVGLA